MAAHRLSLICLLLYYVVFSSCAGPPRPHSSTVSRSYEAPLAQVYEAARRGFQRLNLNILEGSADRHYLKGGRYAEFADGGERVQVWLEDVGAGYTRVWIDTEKGRWVLDGAYVDWSPKLFDHIQQEVQLSKREALEERHNMPVSLLAGL